jgi:exopolysaccharide production protein ExoQ
MPLAQKLNTPIFVPRDLALFSQSDPGPSKFEVWFAAAVLFFSTGAFGDFTADPLSGDDAIARNIWLLIFTIFAATLVKRRKQIFALFAQRWTVVLLLGWANLSMLWSEDPKRTAVHGTMLALSTLFAVYYAERFPFRQQIRMLLIALGAVALLSLFAGMIFPGVAIMTDPPSLAGCWRGIIGHKNGLGKLMALTIVLAAICPGSKLVRGGLMVIALVLLGLSQSGSALLVLLLMLTVIPLTTVLRLRKKQLVLAGLTGFVALVTAGFAIDWNLYSVFYFILDKLGKSTTLTGRGPLWFVLLGFVQRQPWAGYGFDAFWLGPDSTQMSQLWRVMVWKPHNAHNGVLQVILDLGLIGFVLFTAVLAVLLISALKQARMSKKLEDGWPLIFLVFFMAANIAEASVFAPHDLIWIVFMAVTYTTVRAREPHASDHNGKAARATIVRNHSKLMVQQHG